MPKKLTRGVPPRTTVTSVAFSPAQAVTTVEQSTRALQKCIPHLRTEFDYTSVEGKKISRSRSSIWKRYRTSALREGPLAQSSWMARAAHLQKVFLALEDLAMMYFASLKPSGLTITVAIWALHRFCFQGRATYYMSTGSGTSPMFLPRSLLWARRSDNRRRVWMVWDPPERIQEKFSSISTRTLKAEDKRVPDPANL